MNHTEAALAAIERSRTIGGLAAAQLLVAEAQVHATLALAASVSAVAPEPKDLPLEQCDTPTWGGSAEPVTADMQRRWL